MTTVLLTALALSIGLGYFGWLIQKQIWSGAISPSTPVEYGRKFAGYVVVAASISGANFFIKNELVEALIKFAIILLAFPSIGFAVGWLFGFFKKQASSRTAINEEGSEVLSENLAKSLLLKLTPSLIATFAVGVAVLSILYMVANSNSSTAKQEATEKPNWIPNSNLHVESYLNLKVEGKFNYFDEASLSKSGGYTYGFIGFDTEKERSDGTNFVKQKVEADCSVPKYRRIESYRYSEGVDEGFGRLIEADKNFQKTIATRMLAGDKNYVHNGGWTTRAAVLSEIEKYSNRNEDFVAYAKRDLAILNWLCN